jgi:hypothetical protein
LPLNNVSWVRTRLSTWLERFRGNKKEEERAWASCTNSLMTVLYLPCAWLYCTYPVHDCTVLTLCMTVLYLPCAEASVSWYRDTMLLEPDNSLYFRSKGSLHTMTIRHTSTSHTTRIPDVLGKGTPCYMLFVRSVRETSSVYESCCSGTRIHTTLYTFSRLFVLNVHKVGHPAK